MKFAMKKISNKLFCFTVFRLLELSQLIAITFIYPVIDMAAFTYI